jgi:hypothetical protein
VLSESAGRRLKAGGSQDWLPHNREAQTPIIPITLWNKLAHEFMDFPMGQFLLLSSCTLKINMSFLLELTCSWRYS